MNIRGNYNHTLLASYTGFITQAIINNFTPLLFITFQTNYQISLEKITFLVTANFGIQLLVDLLAILFVDKIGYRISIVSAHLFAAVGLFGLGLFPQLFTDPYSGLLLAVFCYAIGGGLIEVLVSPIVEACPTKNKAGNMSFLHSFYCWGSVFVILGSTIFFSLTGVENWKLLALIWAVVPMLNAVYFSQVPLAPLVEKDERMSLSAMFNTKVFWLFILLMICAGASEQAMSQWASAFAESGLGVSKTIGDLAGPGFFAVLMGLARVFYARISEKYNLMKFMLASSVLCIISYLLAAFSSLPLLSLLGCALCGLSVGIFWPGTLSIATRNCPKGGSALFAMLALAGDVGCSAGPTLVGMVSAAFGNNLKIGLAAAFIFPFLMFTGVAFSIKNKAKPY
ncbi:MAG TPA: MFS transporter [Firmicutes bacterium]|nr:MFS transporter [Bacillota bacterium]